MLRRAVTSLKASRGLSARAAAKRQLLTGPGNAAQIRPNFKLPFRAASVATLVVGAATLAYYFPPVEFAYHPQPKLSDPIKGDAHHHHTSAEIEKLLRSSPIVEALRREAFMKGESDLWKESRLYATAVPAHSTHLIPHVLLGNDKLSIPPLVRTRQDGSEAVTVLHVGTGVCGHNGIIHGGFIATLFDQLLYNLGVMSTPAKTGATANLSIDYRAPARADQFLVLRTTVEERAQTKSGRAKITVKGVLESEDGKILAEGRAIIVEPRDTVKFLTEGQPTH